MSASAKPMTLKLGVPSHLCGEVSGEFKPVEPFKFLAP